MDKANYKLSRVMMMMMMMMVMVMMVLMTMMVVVVMVIKNLLTQLEVSVYDTQAKAT